MLIAKPRQIKTRHDCRFDLNKALKIVNRNNVLIKLKQKF